MEDNDERPFLSDMKKKITILISGQIPAMLSFLSVGIAFAQGTTGGVSIKTSSDFLRIVCSIWSVMGTVLVFVSVIMALYAAFKYAIARGDEEEITKAKRILIYSAYGVAAGVLSFGFPTLIAAIFGQSYTTCGNATSSIIP